MAPVAGRRRTKDYLQRWETNRKGRRLAKEEDSEKWRIEALGRTEGQGLLR